jgi:hypothetical protein
MPPGRVPGRQRFLHRRAAASVRPWVQEGRSGRDISEDLQDEVYRTNRDGRGDGIAGAPLSPCESRVDHLAAGENVMASAGPQSQNIFSLQKGDDYGASNP